MSAVENVSEWSRDHAATATKLVALLALAILINYVDRGNLATAAPLIKDELHLTNVEFGWLTSAFFWTYTPAILLASWLADRINPYRTLAIGFALWSAATAMTGFAGGFVALFALRFLLGLGESAAFPCSSKLLAEHLPPGRLGIANGFLVAGVAWGPAFGTLVGGFLMAAHGWRVMFIVFGVLAFVWLWPWLSVTRNAPVPSQHPNPLPPPPYAAIFRLREMWGATIGHFGINYVLYFVLSWLPLYLVKERGFTIVEMAQISAVVYGVMGASNVFFGWLSDRWIAAGGSITSVRKTTIVAGHIGVAIGLIGTVLSGPAMAIVSLMFCGFCFGTNGSSLWSMTQTLAGPRATARWVGIQNCLANFAGIIAPIVTGFIADRTGSFDDAFFVTAAISVIGAGGWLFLVGRVTQVNWDAARA